MTSNILSTNEKETWSQKRISELKELIKNYVRDSRTQAG